MPPPLGCHRLSNGCHEATRGREVTTEREPHATGVNAYTREKGTYADVLGRNSGASRRTPQQWEVVVPPKILHVLPVSIAVDAQTCVSYN
jgi:hypothetical protein